MDNTEKLKPEDRRPKEPADVYQWFLRYVVKEKTTTVTAAHRAYRFEEYQRKINEWNAQDQKTRRPRDIPKEIKTPKKWVNAARDWKWFDRAAEYRKNAIEAERQARIEVSKEFDAELHDLLITAIRRLAIELTRIALEDTRVGELARATDVLVGVLGGTRMRTGFFEKNEVTEDEIDYAVEQMSGTELNHAAAELSLLVRQRREEKNVKAAEAAAAGQAKKKKAKNKK